MLFQVLFARFKLVFRFYNPYKHQKTPGFVMFSGVIEIEHWLKWVKSRNKGAAKYCSTRNLGKFLRKRDLELLPERL